MEKKSTARSQAATPTAGDGASHVGDAKASPSAIAPPRRKITQEERAAAMKFFKAAHEDALLYLHTDEEDTEEEYRRAGRLHVYDPDTEWQKRC